MQPWQGQDFTHYRNGVRKYFYISNSTQLGAWSSVGHIKGRQSPQSIHFTNPKTSSLNLLSKKLKLSVPERHSPLIYTYFWLNISHLTLLIFIFIKEANSSRTGSTLPMPGRGSPPHSKVGRGCSAAQSGPISRQRHGPERLPLPRRGTAAPATNPKVSRS